MTSTRDRFDTHVPDSGRNGFYQTELTPEMQEFLDEYLNKDKEEIIQEAREILGFV
jgi:hypothetical protein